MSPADRQSWADLKSYAEQFQHSVTGTAPRAVADHLRQRLGESQSTKRPPVRARQPGFTVTVGDVSVQNHAAVLAAVGARPARDLVNLSGSGARELHNIAAVRVLRRRTGSASAAPTDGQRECRADGQAAGGGRRPGSGRRVRDVGELPDSGARELLKIAVGRG